MAHLETKALFAGHHPADHLGAVKPPIHPASTFVFPTAEEGAARMESAYGVEGAQPPNADGYIYSRLSNPTLELAEKRLAAWDGADGAAFFASGMAAITTTLIAWSGAHRPVWYCSPLYGGTEHFIREILPQMGVRVCELNSLSELDAMLDSESGALPGCIYLETPANPTLQIHRIQTATAWAREHEEKESHPIQVIVDNTYMGPILQRPLALGADLLVYSATKYLGGHSDLVAGAASGRAASLERVREYRHFLGGMADPHTAWMLARSMETLAIRVNRQQETAEKVFAFLRHHPAVYGLKTAFPQDLSPDDCTIAAEQMVGGGSMGAFEVRGGRRAAFQFLNRLEHFQLAVSLGSTESLAEHPASMTHAGVPPETKEKFGIREGLIRLSIGLEHPDDLIADLNQALANLD
jgi:methionine-gamma-lyase